MDKQKRINWLKDRISSMEQCRDEMPFGLSEDESMELSAYKDSLTSLKAEPEFYVVVTSAGVWQSFKKCRAEAEFIISRPFNPNYKIVEIFTSPPVPEFKIPDTELFNNLSGEMMQKSLDSKGIAAKAYSEAAHKIALTAKDFRNEIKLLNGLGE